MALQSFDDGNSDAARQFLLDNRRERKHPKRHRTMKRSKALGKAKRERIKQNNLMRYIAAQKYHAAVRLYWQGLADHPGW